MSDKPHKNIRSEKIAYRAGRAHSFSESEVMREPELFGPGEIVLSPADMNDFIREMESIRYNREMMNRFPRAKARALEILKKRMGNGNRPESKSKDS